MREGTAGASASTDGDKTYESAVKDLNNLQTNYQIMEQIRASGGRLNENSIPEFEAFLEKVGHQTPDLDRLNVIHITGTKGKGSTCAFVASILSQLSLAGSTQRKLKIGVFTSPHLIEVRERIQIDGSPISADSFAKYFYETYNALRSPTPPLRKVAPESPDMPMYFRFLTLMAYHVFLRENVDVAVVEVGVGGQYDSTNVIRSPVVCGIASLGLDHQTTLGSTIEQIAWHKAGIIKNAVPAYTVSQDDGALAVIRERAAERSAPLHIVDPAKLLGPSVELGIPGSHQQTNAALAVSLCREWVRRTNICASVSSDALDLAIDAGLRTASWPGRSQTFVSPRNAKLTWHVDGAHTIESMAACAQWFAQIPIDTSNGCHRVLLFNAAHSRNAPELLTTLVKNTVVGQDWFCEAVFCPNISSRSDSVNFTVHNDPNLGSQKDAATVWQQLTELPETSTTVLPTITDAVAHIEAKYGTADDGVPTHVLVTGSLHLVGGVLDAAKGSI
ncbi:Folylpolyglutamate synthetase [Coemansia sp. RSA 1813]|nr:Folylpolyglutamate synthetase [Coemansia sp. RSA 1646]KAJ1770222.1 Folylpolyglutamate synthetase [Coemansia sp. RSA 1843]KAJ2090179.1 Folylpolyglutamate synthetase [Coemansia sp. RSA 986]KAJ2214586.1 Folylpolyglutamate synthetase [Coemansia sp. RSA 487]KAJ2570754.1 Folylpolyglutamate synthetase [Coemansia sp. RSA 1813]